MDESESAAEEMARRREQRRGEEERPDEAPPAPEPQREPRRRTFAELIAPALAAWGAFAGAAARWPGALRARVGAISPRSVGLTLLATVAGAAVALGAAALAGSSGSSSTTATPTTAGPAPAWLGVQTTTSTTSISGATVEVVEPTGPAARAGLTPGDVITELNGQPITSSGGLARALAAMAPGQQVQLQVNRLGQMLIIDTTLARRPPGVP
jgi:membrane-associated protease RseP (regulator of RpoE activity)